jgi:hypothetical protein
MLQVLNGPTIEKGESLSEAVDCSDGQLVRITMPTDWTDAELTFQFSTDGLFFNELYQLDGFAVTLPHVVRGAGVVIPESIGRAIAFIKFRSGTAGNPVVQEETRAFAVTILIEGEEAAPPPVRTKSERTKAKR